MKKILIVEDDRDLTLGLSIRLRAAGYGVVVAQDGASVMSAALKHSPDLILLDIGIPGGNGLVVLERLKQNVNTAYLPVIVMTAWDPATVKEKTRELGAVAFFQKPADSNQLLKVIRRYASAGDPETRAE
jgi:DNA-binding response OmpR family regulator